MSGQSAEQSWIREELTMLWSDLHDANEWAAKPWTWSIRCENLAERIREATAIVGPVDWRDVSMTHLIDGWFQRTNERIGINNPNVPTNAEVAELAEMQRQSDARLRGSGQ